MLIDPYLAKTILNNLYSIYRIPILPLHGFNPSHLAMCLVFYREYIGIGPHS